jgi:uncharacterized glyoxalase superfamily protein PhnB
MEMKIMQVMTQLAFKGQCRQTFGFYEKVLDGKIAAIDLLPVMPSIIS